MRIKIFILGALGSFVGFTTAAPAAPRGYESDYAGPCNYDSDCRGDILICEDTGLQQRHCVVGDRWPYMSRDLSSGTGEPENRPANLEARGMELPKRCTSNDECEAPLECLSAITWRAAPHDICRERGPFDDLLDDHGDD